MIELKAVGSGKIVFNRSNPTSRGGVVINYLVQHIDRNGKKSGFTITQFADEDITPFKNGTEIEFYGVWKENKYKIGDEFKSSGMEIIADIIKVYDETEDVFK
jgi:hypothetical protein